MRLRFPSYDGTTYARLGHGDDCVLLIIEDPDSHAEAGIVLMSGEAAALGRALVRQAAHAKAAHSESREGKA